MVQAAHMAAASGGDVPVVSQRSPLAHHMLSLPRLFREEKQHSDGVAVVDLACFSLLTERKVVETLVAYTTEQVRSWLSSWRPPMGAYTHNAGLDVSRRCFPGSPCARWSLSPASCRRLALT